MARKRLTLGNPTGRRPGIGGVVMHDVSEGKERFRAWPRKRGTPKTKVEREANTKFRMAQLATKYISPAQYADWMIATEGTALLPRDMMVAMFYGRLLAFVNDQNEVIWPMAAKTSVDEALDIITRTVGDILWRGENGWYGAPPPSSPGGSAVFTEVHRASPVGLSSAAWRKVPFDAKTTDPQDWWNASTNRFQPNLEGNYQFTARLQTYDKAINVLAIRKNGSEVLRIGTDTYSSEPVLQGQGIVHMNGTTDYAEIWVYVSQSKTLSDNNLLTWAQMLGPV